MTFSSADSAASAVSSASAASATGGSASASSATSLTGAPAAPEITLSWLSASEAVNATSEQGQQISALINEVVDTGAAIVWQHHPSIPELQEWLDSWPARIADGSGNVALISVDGVIRALGVWTLPGTGPVGHVAMLSTIMTSPQARGLGLGSRVVDTLISGATQAGAEIIRLGVRSNNQAAIALYESRGFVEWGRIPDGVAVGNLRFDDVNMYKTITRPTDAISIGDSPEGPGASRRR